MSDADPGTNGAPPPPAPPAPATPGVEARVAAATAARVQAERQLAERETAWAEERALLVAGYTDPEAIDVARYLWSRVAPEQRPAGGLQQWLQTPPAALHGYRPPPAAPPPPAPAPGDPPPAAAAAAPPPPPPAPAPPGLPPSNRGAAATPPSGGGLKLTAAEISQLSPEDYARLRPDILAGRR